MFLRGWAQRAEKQERRHHPDQGRDDAAREGGLEASVTTTSGFPPWFAARWSSARDTAAVAAMATRSAPPELESVSPRPEASRSQVPRRARR